MSEEETKELEHIKKRAEFVNQNIMGTNVFTTYDIHCVNTLIKIIEKQQKEIDELERTLYAKQSMIDELTQSEEKLKIELAQEKEKNKELSDKLTEKICKGAEEDILEEYRQRIKELEEEDVKAVLQELDSLKFKYQARKDRTNAKITKQEKMIENVVDRIEYYLMGNSTLNDFNVREKELGKLLKILNTEESE